MDQRKTSDRTALLRTEFLPRFWACLAALCGLVAFSVADDADLIPNVPTQDGPKLSPRAGWPLWLKDYNRHTRTSETSGITFLGRDAAGTHRFFLVDDVGAAHLCSVSKEGPQLRLEDVALATSLLDELRTSERLDFEALALDPAPRFRAASPAVELPDSVAALLSVEGRGPAYRETTRLLRVELVRRERWRLESRGEAISANRFWSGVVGPNRGFEGIAATERHLFLGLESHEQQGDFNLEGSVIFIYDRQADRVTSRPTFSSGIYSIVGLDAISDTVTVLLDRSRQSIFILRWDAERPGKLDACHRFPLDLPAPDGFRYAVPSLAGIAVDDQGDFWCVTDPWHGHYHAIGAAPESLKIYLAAEIPMLYRFPGESAWAMAGLSGLWAGN